MVDPSLLPAIRAALRENEIGNQSPYVLTYARLGNSGGSFGVFQGDACVDPNARAALKQALVAAGVASATVTRIVNAVSQPCPDGSPLSPADQKTADDALDSPQGRAIVDAMDGKTIQIVLGELDSSIAAAEFSQQAARSRRPDLDCLVGQHERRADVSQSMDRRFNDRWRHPAWRDYGDTGRRQAISQGNQVLLAASAKSHSFRSIGRQGTGCGARGATRSSGDGRCDAVHPHRRSNGNGAVGVLWRTDLRHRWPSRSERSQGRRGRILSAHWTILAGGDGHAQHRRAGP